MKRNLHILVPSQLHITGGGIETWLIYFLRNISLKHQYQDIFVYGFQSAEKVHTIPELEFNENVRFLLSSLSKKRNGAANILNFVRTHEKSIKQNLNDNDHILIIGSVFLAPFLVRIRRLKYARKLKTILWVRSKTIGELKARKSKYVFFAKLFEKKVIKNCDLIITNGKDTQDYYESIYPKHKNKMYTVFNAVNFNKYSNIKIENISILNKSLNVIYLGRYIKAKGFDSFIDSIQQLSSASGQNYSLKFISYGHGHLSECVGNIPLIDKGPYTQKELHHLLEENHVVVFLNKSKNAGGLSHALLEVMAAGKIVIAWKNQVHCQILNNSNSILVEEGNINELSKAYIDLYNNLSENESYYNKLREKARKTAEKYSEENHIEDFLRVVETHE